MNKTAVITGAASGLGFELSRLLARHNYMLILIDINIENLNKAEDELINEFETNVIRIEADLGKPNAPEEIYEKIRGYNVDILINNAGYGLSGAFSETDWKHEESMIYLHVLTPTHLTKLVLKDMLQRGNGRIMNISSVAALGPGPLMSVYYATKAYLVSFGTAVAYELKGSGVTMTTFCPGMIKTDFKSSVAKRSRVPKMSDGVFTDNAERIAKIAFKAMMKGKAVHIPLLKNKALAFMLWILPSGISALLIKKIQENIHKQR